MNFKQVCNQWKSLDNLLIEKKQKIKSLENKKKILSQNIIKYITERKLEHKKFKFDDGTSFKMNSNSIQSGLSLTFLKNVLNEYSKKYNNSLNSEHCLDFIKKKRTKKINKTLKLHKSKK